MNTAREEKAAALALDILELSRAALTVRFRFLDRSLARLGFQKSERVLFGTDGRHILYDPWYVLSTYREEPEAVVRDILHSILHLVFRHPFVGADIDRELWSLAADIAAEETATELHVITLRESAQRETLTLLREELGTLTAERLYRWLSEHLQEHEREEWRKRFAADQHGPWFGADESAAVDTELETQWQEVSRRMQTELESFSENGSLLAQKLRTLNRPRTSLRTFLRRFGRSGEVMRISEEELDTNYYTYGLSLYGNIPLVEPLEYREENRIREFVIAIDTSGSVRGEIVQNFVEYVYEILVKSESFFTDTRLHILQCDDRIREDVRITSAAEWEDYFRNMTVLGLGETDFRPVFRRVEELLAQGEFRDLRGLLYFTDGKGTFPTKRPSFPTALVLHTDGFEEPPTPPWAMKMIISEDDVLANRFE